MTELEKVDWLCNVQNSAAVVASLLGEEVVEHILQKYGCSSLDDLCPAYYDAVFDELDFIAGETSGFSDS
jgi:hypothetical protein